MDHFMETVPLALVSRKVSLRCMPHVTFWFFLCALGEDMRKWDVEPTFKPEASVCEPKQKAGGKKGSPKKPHNSLVAVEMEEGNQ